MNYYVKKFLLVFLICILSSCGSGDTNKTAIDYIGEGVKFTEQQKYNKAISSFKKAITTDPTNPLAHYSLGGIYTMKDMNEKAIEEYKKAIELDPLYSDPHYSLGFVYEKLKKEKEAKQEYLLFEMLRGENNKQGAALNE